MTSSEELKRKPAITFIRATVFSENERALKLMSAIKAGMEEEGVPWLESKEDSHWKASEGALKGARNSQLGVGIGLDLELSVAVCFHRADNAIPLFSLSEEEVTEKKARIIGANAARLVKKIPFKDIEE